MGQRRSQDAVLTAFPALMRLALPIALALSPVAAAAWSEQGHMATGLIAYDDLVRRDPGAVATIRKIMLAHPDRARFDKATEGLSGAARDRRLFALMARWPDDARDTAEDQPEWHYYGRIVAGWTWIGATVGDADVGYNRNLAVLRAADSTPAARAVALCWLFHIVGDMHQPLHAGHRIDTRFPLTDRLGTIAHVREAAGATDIVMHQLWDKALDRRGDDVGGAEAIAAVAVPLTPAQHDVASFDVWAAESAALAKSRGYPPETMVATRDAAAASVLSARYLSRMRSLSRVRVAQAGVRLSALLMREMR